MGCDIHAFVEKYENGKWNFVAECFKWRQYGLYGFLANVRNYSCVPFIQEGRGIPKDCSEYVKNQLKGWDCDAHSPGYVTMRELFDYDYNTKFGNRRVTRQVSTNIWSGASICDEDDAEYLTIGEFLGSQYFKELVDISMIGIDNVRIVFFFDN